MPGVARQPRHRPRNMACATRSPGLIPSLRAVPPITSSTARTGPPAAMILVDSGSVFSAMRWMRPSARMKIMSRGMYVFFIHMVTFMSCLKSNIMPRPSGSSLRNMRPRVRSSSVSANSTVNVWTPPRVTISTVCSSAAKVGPEGDRTRRMRAAAASAARNIGWDCMDFSYTEARARSMGGGRAHGRALRPDLGRHQALRAGAEAHQDELPRPQLGQSIPAQGLHVDENVRGALPARQEAESAQAVEQFDLGALETAGRRHRDVSTRRRHLRRMDRGGVVHRQDPEGLQALGTLQDLAHDARALIGGLEAVTAQAGDVQEHVRQAVVGNDEAVAFGDVEPFDRAGELDHAHRGLIGYVANCLGSKRIAWV